MTQPSERDREMVANVRASTDAALRALRHFRQSLVRAGLREGAASYRTMCETVYSQAIWMLDKQDAGTAQNLEALRAVARSIVDILEPYTASIGRLTELPTLSGLEAALAEPWDASEPDAGTEAGRTDSEPSPEEQVVAYLTTLGRRASASRIRSSTGLRRAELDEAMQTLQREGRVVTHRVGGRDLFTVA